MNTLRSTTKYIYLIYIYFNYILYKKYYASSVGDFWNYLFLLRKRFSLRPYDTLQISSLSGKSFLLYLSGKRVVFRKQKFYILIYFFDSP